MNSTLQEAIMSARMNKDMGLHANLGDHYANKRTHKQYLRANKLGKFRRGK